MGTEKEEDGEGGEEEGHLLLTSCSRLLRITAGCGGNGLWEGGMERPTWIGFSLDWSY